MPWQTHLLPTCLVSYVIFPASVAFMHLNIDISHLIYLFSKTILLKKSFHFWSPSYLVLSILLYLHHESLIDSS